MRPPPGETILRLSVLQSFASLWLLPRLAAFKQARPDLDVEIETSAELVDLTDDRFDAAIRFGTRPLAGPDRRPAVRDGGLSRRRARDACVRAAAVSRAALDTIVLFDIVQAPDLWPQYLAGVGLARLPAAPAAVFDNAQVMYEAVANGLGIALAVDELGGAANCRPAAWSSRSATSRYRCARATTSSAARSAATSRRCVRCARRCSGTPQLACADVTRAADIVVCR